MIDGVSIRRFVLRRGDLLVTGLVYALILGAVGGLLPGLRAARMPVTAGLREL